MNCIQKFEQFQFYIRVTQQSQQRLRQWGLNVNENWRSATKPLNGLTFINEFRTF